jgi:UDP-N-acetylmuramate dehydrogenase
MRLERDVPLAPLTTLRLGGAAARVAVIEREEDVPEALAEAERAGVAAFVLGGGSNLVVGDEGTDALVLRMASRGVAVEVRDGDALVTLAAGEPWDPFVTRAVGEGFSGVECLGGIPGLVGATPIQNVGAYGQEVKDTVAAVRAYDRDARAFVDLTPEDCAFGYRASRLKATGRYVVTAVTFRLPVRDAGAPVRYAELAKALGIVEGATAPLARVHETVVALRRTKGMVLDAADPESVSAGSFFVNPVVDDAGLARIVAGAIGLDVPRHAAGAGDWKVPAAWLIERAGFARGYGAGPVRVSRRHSLALVHTGGGTTRQLLALAREIASGVEARFGVGLTPEPVMLGCSL